MQKQAAARVPGPCELGFALEQKIQEQRIKEGDGLLFEVRYIPES